MRTRSIRPVGAAVAAVSVILAGCSERSTTAPATGASASPAPLAIFEQTPPPPPLDDLLSDVGGSSAGCEAAPPGTVVDASYAFSKGLSARLLVNRPGTNAIIDLGSADPLITVSRNARLREHNGELTGQGTITIDVVEAGSIVRTLVVDLSTATGTLTGVTSDGRRFARFEARLTRADGTPETVSCSGGATIWYRDAFASFTY